MNTYDCYSIGMAAAKAGLDREEIHIFALSLDNEGRQSFKQGRISSLVMAAYERQREKIAQGDLT